MFQCHVCSATESHTEQVNEVFQINGKFYLVEQIPAQVCSRCGEVTFNRETTERIRQMLHGESQPVKSINVDVFAYQ
ncbi:MAG: YgiT-type zinc finger protein [Oscillatoriales cyanobacterium]|uniref:YgiT-type zinc finger protein n=1 Tax=Microcoleus anatoxicus PTRS2 TaxID=2705321 RepID=A0ABU8YL15_9CYAN|nr:MAG: YgiT-type zinc finger protein [Oscillatoriales cyanobacterium]TAD93723.1 MAG: YgiT-type zinc finger protein [Oscillatoriales cyanobacterium]TAE03312.1 MAG: YgiT-type zinc finger protein [Oscillatoriales cyanobacterium]